jgi:hypothetical protein
MPQVELSDAEIAIILSDLSCRRQSLISEAEMLGQLQKRLIDAVQGSANESYRT